MNKYGMVWCLLVSLGLGSLGFAQPPAADVKVSAKKWLSGEKGYREALDIQQKTGADMVVYFYRYDEKDEKGLCSWWEKYGMDNGKVSRHLEPYIKVKMQLPYQRTEKETFNKFFFNKCPAVFVVKAGSSPERVPVFDWPDNRPKLRSPDELIAAFTAASAGGKPAFEKPGSK